MMQTQFREAMNLGKTTKADNELALTAIAGVSALKIPEGKAPVSPELLQKMQAHYHKLKKKHVTWSHDQLTKATSGFFNVEIVNETPDAD